jgi:hypothetical protein
MSAGPVDWHPAPAPTARGWAGVPGFARLPLRAQTLVNERAWNAARASAGVTIEWETDADAVWVRWRLADEPRVGWCGSRLGAHGVDLWCRVGDRWHWLGAGDATQGRANEARLVKDLPRAPRRMRLYLPYGNHPEAIDLGVPPGCTLTPVADPCLPVVWYGSSIVQGEHVARAGSGHAARVGRIVDRTVINLGFGGGAKLEPAMAGLLGEIAAACYVIEPLPNCDAELVAARAAPFFAALRAARPQTPIIAVEDPGHALAPLRDDEQRRLAAKHRAWNDALAAVAGPVTAIPHRQLIAPDGDGSVDGIHRTDAGAAHLAAVIAPAVQAALG